MKEWAAACVMVTVLLWLGCTFTIVWKGNVASFSDSVSAVLQEKLFFAPVPQEWLENEMIEKLEQCPEEKRRREDEKNPYRMASGCSGGDTALVQRHTGSDGLYSLSTPGPESGTTKSNHFRLSCTWCHRPNRTILP